MKKVALLGIAGSFHEDAASRYFTEPIEILECHSFKQICDKVDTDEADYAVLAIENSIVGSLLNNYALVRDYHLRIIGEIYIHIQMNLMVNQGVKKEDIQEIQSIPVALKQCTDYIEEHFKSAKLRERSDTATAAKLLKMSGDVHAAAIGNDRSAKIYGLEILEKGIETNKMNYTRFLILSKHSNPEVHGDKASISFKVGHFCGALSRVLDIFTDNQINLAKIQSVPILGKPNEYSFHVDLEWSSYENYEKAIHLVLKNVSSLAILGEYCRAEIPFHD